MVSVPATIFDQTIAQLRRCGAFRNECVVYWLADVDHLALVAEVIHPAHTAAADGYGVDSDWLTRFSFELAETARTAVAQVHTHPGHHTAHSWVDDEFVLVPSPGFISIVIPAYAADDRLDDWHVTVLQADGVWRVDQTAIG